MLFPITYFSKTKLPKSSGFGNELKNVINYNLYIYDVQCVNAKRYSC